MKCIYCKEPLEPGWQVCPVCERPIIQIITCSTCGKELKSNWVKCPGCQTPTGKQSGAKPTHMAGGNVGNSPTGYSMGIAQTKVEQADTIPHIALNPGDQVGNYTIKEKLGQGGFGSVYRATENLLEEDHALKVMPLISRDYVKNILLEFKSRDKIKSFENIIKAWQPQPVVYQGQDILLYPMELADMTFRKWLNEHKSNPETVMKQGIGIFKQACRGVEAIHNAGLTHLDIKPENILLIKDPVKKGQWIAKIADFGLARGVGMETLAALEDGIGTPAYMAPEQIIAARWKDVGPEADIYALGMILYEMIDGDLPYSGTPRQIKEKKRDASIKISPLKDNSPVAKLAMECLNRDPEMRPDFLELTLLQLKIAKNSKKTIENDLYSKNSNKQEKVKDKKDKIIESRNLRQNKINKHLRNQSNIIQPIKHKEGIEIICPYCQMLFYTEVVGEGVDCPHCNKNFTVDNDYKIIGAKSMCPFCEYAHYYEDVSKEIRCISCGKYFAIDQKFKVICKDVGDLKFIEEKYRKHWDPKKKIIFTRHRECPNSDKVRINQESSGFFRDPRDDNEYRWVKIGNQVWMENNLRYMPHVSPPEVDGGIWVNRYRGNSISEVIDTLDYLHYGCLYDWDTALRSCPPGWHLPSDEEWLELFNSVVGEADPGRELIVKNFGSLFGNRILLGDFVPLFHTAYFWSSTRDDFSTNNAHFWQLIEKNYLFFSFTLPIDNGLSVRCVRNN